MQAAKSAYYADESDKKRMNTPQNDKGPGQFRLPARALHEGENQERQPLQPPMPNSYYAPYTQNMQTPQTPMSDGQPGPGMQTPQYNGQFHSYMQMPAQTPMGGEPIASPSQVSLMSQQQYVPPVQDPKSFSGAGPTSMAQFRQPTPTPATGWQGSSLNISRKHQVSPPPFAPGEQGIAQFQLPVQSGQYEAFPVTDKHSNSQFRIAMPGMPAMSAPPTQFSPETGQQRVPFMPPETGKQGVSQWQLPVTGRQNVPSMLPPMTGGMPSYMPMPQVPQQLPMTDRHNVAPPLTSATKGTGKRRVTRMVLIVNAVLAVVLVAGGLTAWMLSHHASLPQAQKTNGSSTTAQVSTAPALNSITNNKDISPLLFGTNMGLYHNADEPMLHSPQTLQALKDIGVRSVRMPTRPTLGDQTEMAAAQAIKDIGAVPLVVIAGPGYPNGSILQTNQHTLSIITKVFGNQTVYYEFGNESDLAGITAQQYVTIWNQVVPVLKQQFPTARFVGPDNYEFTRNYLTTFLQQAKPLPDGVSWHEYACSINWSASVCLENVDAWNVHFAQARAAMQEAIGKTLPIWITEWNYASDTNGQLVKDGKANNPAFMQAWTEKAMQTLVANRIFAAMQYYATDAPMPLVNNGQVGIEGKIFQQEYKTVMVDGKTPPMATMTYPTPTKTVSPNEAFSFEDGNSDGWADGGGTPLVNTTAQAFDGTHSLQYTLPDNSVTDMPFIAVDVNNMQNAPKAGQTLTAYLYVANPKAIINAKIFVANPQHAWIFANSLTLTAGHWNKIWLGLPETFSNDAAQVGIQFFTSSPGVSTTIYLDSVSWQ